MSLINVATLEMIKDILKGVTIPKKATIAEQLGEDTVGSTSVPIYLNKGVAAQATDVVNTSAAQTISAVKTFSVAPKISATLSSSLNDTTVVHAQWVNARIASEIENIGSSGSGSGSSDVDLSDYATTEWVESTLEAYATTEWVASRIAEAQLSGGEVDLSAYATKEWVESTLDYYVDLTNSQTINGYKSFMNGIYASAITTGESISFGGNTISLTNSGSYLQIAIGNNSSATGTYDVAVGPSCKASGGRSIAAGFNSSASGGSSVAIGNQATAEYDYSTAIGYRAATTTANTIWLGTSTISYVMGAGSYNTTSDERDKTDFIDFNDEQSLEFVTSLRTFSYLRNPRGAYEYEEEENEQSWEYHKKYGLGLYDHEAHAAGTKKGSRRRAGFSAQDIQEKMKAVYGDEEVANLVCDSLYDKIQAGEEIPEGVESQLTVGYVSMIPLLVSAMRAQQKQIEELKAKLEE